MAAVLNAASNALNQIYDLEIDRVNKPKRPAAERTADDRATPGCSPRRPTPSRWCSPGWSRRAAGTSASGSSRRDGHHVPLFGAAAAHEAARHLGERHDRDSARRAAQGRRLVVGEDGHRPSSRGSSARSSACSCSARPRPRTSPTWKATPGRVPDAADPLRRAPRRVDDLALVRPAVPDDHRRRLRRRPHRQLLLLHVLLGAVMTRTASTSAT